MEYVTKPINKIGREFSHDLALLKASKTTQGCQQITRFYLHRVILFLLAFTALPSALSGQEFGQNFIGSPRKQYGGVACQNQGNPYNGNWQSYFSYDSSSITITAGNDCRQLNTGTNAGCVFDIGDNGLTEISFDFEISEACHNSVASTDWLAFWMCSAPWVRTAEVDFIESVHGPANGGLNSNFGGLGNQQHIFLSSDTAAWKGSIRATFSGSGNEVQVSVHNSINTNVASSTLSQDSNYIFVFNTTQTTESGCTMTISNVRAKGTLTGGTQANNCTGITITN